MNLKIASLQAPCSNCKTEVRFMTEDAMAQQTIHCPGCGSEIRLIDENGSVKTAVGKIQNELNNLVRKINLKF